MTATSARCCCNCLRGGWLGRTAQLVPYARIQSITLTQGPVERRLDLATVRLRSTVGEGTAFRIYFPRHEPAAEPAPEGLPLGDLLAPLPADSSQLAAVLAAAEGRDFVNGVTPAFSRTGKWQDVSHYTQMIWRNTTRVGCAIASNRRDDYLVCRYSPPGNVVGQRTL